MKSTLRYRDIGWAEMDPDLYSGKNYDEIRPRWRCYMEGDMEYGYEEELILSSKHFPVGTKIFIKEPECPKCCQVVEFCRSDDSCDFDWDLWIQETYS